MKSSFFKIASGFLFVLLLAGCQLSTDFWRSSEDPFDRATGEEEFTLEGEIFSFDLSVATQATHRLEKDGKLVALLTSDIIPLEQFEQREVRLMGVYRTEKMRQIFWVTALEFLNLTAEEEEIQTEERFLAKDFSFVFPATWEYSTSPDGTAYFSEKEDPAKRVFLKFSVGAMSRADKALDPNILIANLSGYKKSTTEDNVKREQQTIMLFANISDKKYSFSFTSQFEDFDKKKAFFSLLNSFIEGEEAVEAAREADLKLQAARILEKVRQEEEQKKLADLQESLPGNSASADAGDGLLSRIVEKIKTTEDEEGETFTEEDLAEEIVVERATEAEMKKWEFANLLNAKAFPYQSQGLKFGMQVPYGFWFRNFGAVDGKLGVIGFAKHDFTVLSEADFTLQVVEKNGGLAEKEIQVTESGNLVIKFPRENFSNSYIQLVGPPAFRDAMLSVEAGMTFVE